MFITVLVSVWSDDWRRGLPAADPDRHREDHEHQAGTRPQDLQRHSHVQKHRRGAEVTLPHSPGAIILCQNHSVAGKKKKTKKKNPEPFFFICLVSSTHQREREKRRGGIKLQNWNKEIFFWVIEECENQRGQIDMEAGWRGGRALFFIKCDGFSNRCFDIWSLVKI